MVGVYIIIAVGAVLLVSFLVDELPSHLYTKSRNIKGEILELILSTGAPFMLHRDRCAFNASTRLVRMLFDCEMTYLAS